MSFILVTLLAVKYYKSLTGEEEFVTSAAEQEGPEPEKQSTEQGGQDGRHQEKDEVLEG